MTLYIMSKKIGALLDKIMDRIAADEAMLKATTVAYKDHWRDYVKMNLNACHCNGCELDFDRLLAADDESFWHDIHGISTYIDPDTGELTDCFVPRYVA